MRKLSTIIYGIIIAISISSCSNEDNDIFGESPAKRLNRAVKEYTELLCSSESGWAMEYFANEKKKGYTLLIQFRKTDGVTIAAQDDYTKNEYTKEDSHFKVIADNGPVLSFNTYNTLLHYFADPAGDTADGNNGDGRGHEGDYEFIVMKTSDDLIELQGKKRGYTILLRRLPEGQDWEAYLKKLEDVKNSLFSKKIPTLWFAAPNGEKYTFSNPYSGVFDVVPEGGDAISQTVKVPFIMQENGVRLMAPFTGNHGAFSVQTFSITENGYLSNMDNGTALITAPSPIAMFNNESTWKNGSKWAFVKNGMGGRLKEIFDVISQKSLATFKYEFDYSFRVSSKVAGQALSFERNGLEMGAKAITAKVDENHPEQIRFTILNKTEAGWSNIAKYIPEVEQFATQLASTTYTVHTTDYALKPSVLKLVSTTDVNDYLIISIE